MHGANFANYITGVSHGVYELYKTCRLTRLLAREKKPKRGA
jgi:hypothetical protein